MKTIAAGFALTLTVPAAVAGQGRPVEIGVGLSAMNLVFSAGQTVFGFRVTEPVVSAAFYVSDKVAIEPRLGAEVVAADAGSAAVAILDLGVPLYFKPEGGRRGTFVRPLVGAAIVSADLTRTGDADVQFSAGAGIGSKAPIGDRAAFRFEGQFRYVLESDAFAGGVSLGFVVGMSVFFGGQR